MSKELELNIDENGLSSKLGGKLEQVASMPKLSNASIAALCLSLTGSGGLNQVADLAEKISQGAADQAMDLQEQVFNYAYGLLETALSDSGVIEPIQTGVDLASKTLAFGKKGLEFVNSGATVAANIVKLSNTLCAIQDPDTTVTPSVKESTSLIGASLDAILEAAWNEIKQQSIELYNSMICTSSSSTVDNALASINGILDKVGPLIDPYMAKYTGGHTTSEIRYICNTGFALVNMLKRASSKAKEKRETKKAQKAATAQAEKESESTSSNSSNESEKTAMNDAAKGVADSAKKTGEDIANNAKETGTAVADSAKETGKTAANQVKDFADELSKDFSKDQIKAKLMEWLDQQSFGLRNAFQLLMIKDSIEEIQKTCENLTNNGIDNLADFVNATQIVFQIFDLIGYEYGKSGITLDDFQALAQAIADTAVDAGQDITNQVKAASEKMRSYGASVANSAKSEATAIASKAEDTAKGAADQAKSTASGVANTAKSAAEGAVDQAKNTASNVANTAKDATSNISNSIDISTGLSNISNGIDISTGLSNLSNISNGLDNISLGTLSTDSSTATYTGTPYLITSSEVEEKTTTTKITLYINPSSSDDIAAFIKSYKNSKNKDLFNIANRKKLKDAFEDAWEDDEEVTETLSAKLDGVTKKYIFIITPDKKSYNEYLASQAASTSDTKSKITNLTSNAKDQATNMAASAASQATDAATGLANDAANQASSLASGVSDQAIGLASDATSSAMGMTSDAKDQASEILSSLSFNIDMKYIEAVFADKVLMFDPIVKILDMMNPLIKALQFLCHLIENYKINTEFVQSNRRASLANAMKTAAGLYNGLKNMITLDDTNFFTIRTKSLANWAMKKLKAVPDDNGFAKVTIDKTLLLYGYCTSHSIYPEEPLNLLKGTTLYFDGMGIKDGNKSDGTSDGLDKIQYNRDLGEVYYDASNRSIFASQILYANGTGCDPYYVKDVSNQVMDEDDKFASLFNSIMVETDEAEGTGAINLDNITCCAKEEVLSEDNEDEIQDVVVVEFGQEYTKGLAVDYTINVKPGQSIDNQTILAYIKKDSSMIPVKSIYSAGTIMSINNDSDYLHIYPQNANRHIVIADPSLSEPDFNIEDVSQFQADMKMSTELYQMILTLMVPSMYPIVLKNARRKNVISYTMSSFNYEVNAYNRKIEERSNELMNTTSADAIKSCSNDPYKLVDIKDNALYIRNVLMYNDALNYYKSLKNATPNGAKSYSDCMGLAYETSDLSKDSTNYGAEANVDLNRNYYVTLLSKISTRSNNQYAIEYYNLINDIINNRLTLESLDVNTIITQFNELYQTCIDSTQANGYGYVKTARKGEFANISVNDKDAIENLITFLKQEYVKYVINNSASYKDESNEIKDTLHDYKDEYDALQTLADAGEVQDSSLSDLYDDIMETLNNADNNSDKKAEKKIYSQRLNVLPAQLANIFIYARTTEAKSIDIKATPKIKVFNSYNTSISDRLATYEWTVNNWILANNGKTKNISYPYIVKTYDSFIEWFNDVYKEAVRRHENGGLYSNINQKASDNAIIGNIGYVADVDEEVKKQIVTYIFNGNEPNDFWYYNKILLPYRKQYINSEKIIEVKNEYINELIYKRYFELTCKEADQIQSFWEKILALYDSTYKYELVEQEIQDYANGLTKWATWPESTQITAGKYKCELYTFINRDVEKAEIPNIDLNDMPEEVTIPAATIDYSQAADLLEPKEGDITILDYEYWLVYMLNATLLTLLPTYWSDGFDVPPFMTPTLLPAIYLPIAPPIKIPFINVLIVFGFSLRGLWPAPIILMVNMSNHDLNAMLPFMVALEVARKAFAKIMETAENIIPKTINKLIDQASEENVGFKKTMDMFRTFAAVIRSMPMENKAIIEEAFADALEEQQQELAEDLADQKAKRDAKKAARKAARQQKKRDKRQVITREEDLGEGEEPM